LANLQYIELARLGQRAFCAADGEPTTFALLLSQEIPKRVKFGSERRVTAATVDACEPATDGRAVPSSYCRIQTAIAENSQEEPCAR
jgi:hypothetical protein